MKTQTIQMENAGTGGFALDTTFVLFFLAVDFGQSAASMGLDVLFSAATLALLVVLPYFLRFEGERPAFGRWVLGRLLIAAFAVGLGIMFRQSLGTVLPEQLRFLPLTLFIVAAMISCYVRFYDIIRFRLAR